MESTGDENLYTKLDFGCNEDVGVGENDLNRTFGAGDSYLFRNFIPNFEGCLFTAVRDEVELYEVMHQGGLVPRYVR
jgi:hypothetical protein